MILKIAGRQIDHFNSFSVTLNYDSLASAFSFNHYFNPDNPEHRELFNPLSYSGATVEHDGELLITGTLLSNTCQDSARKELCGIGGYSVTGVLEDCEIPLEVYPLQSDSISLRDIATKLLRPFGLKMVVDDSVRVRMDKVFQTSTADENQSVKSYLSALASQKNIILSHTPKGEVLFTQANTKQAPIIDFTRDFPSTSYILSVNGQAMHSSITVLRQAGKDGGNAGQSTVDNPFVNAFRPKVRSQDSGSDTDTSEAARNALSEELKNIKLTIETDRWTVGGKVIRPNNMVSVINPEISLHTRSLWFIESVTLSGDNVSERATINCVLPSVYDNSTPINIFD